MSELKEAAQEKTAVTQPQPVTPDFIEAQEQLGEEWLGAIKQSGLLQILRDSDLPEVVKQRLSKRMQSGDFKG